MVKKELGIFIGTLIASAMLIVLAVAYFGLTLWVIKTASGIFFGPGLSADWAVLSATILAAAAIIGSGVGEYRWGMIVDD